MSSDIRIPHKANALDDVIEGAFRVLDDFEAVDASTDAMEPMTLKNEQPGCDTCDRCVLHKIFQGAGVRRAVCVVP